jgi:hypothetical protein
VVKGMASGPGAAPACLLLLSRPRLDSLRVSAFHAARSPN